MPSIVSSLATKVGVTHKFQTTAAKTRADSKHTKKEKTTIVPTITARKLLTTEISEMC